MTDEQLVAAFESAEHFTHANHVRVAWWYLRHAPLPEALARFAEALQRFAETKGAHGKYYETITVAYMLVIAKRLDGARELSWPEFAAVNSDLLAHHHVALMP